MREKIITSAIIQINKYGFRRFSISDITSDLGISSKTVYKYFKEKNEIISAVCDNLIEEEKRKALGTLTSEGNWVDKMMAISCHESELNDQMLQELKKHFPDEWEKVIAMKGFFSKYGMKFMRQGIESGDLRSDINPVILDFILNTLIDSFFKAELKDISQEQGKRELEKVILFGILTPESKLKESR